MKFFKITNDSFYYIVLSIELLILLILKFTGVPFSIIFLGIFCYFLISILFICIINVIFYPEEYKESETNSLIKDNLNEKKLTIADLIISLFTFSFIFLLFGLSINFFASLYERHIFLDSKGAINYKLDYQNYNVVDLNNNKIIDNLHHFKFSFRNNITKKDLNNIEKTLHKNAQKFLIDDNKFLDEQGNHYVFSPSFFQKEYDLKEVYFNKKNYSIKSVYSNKEGNKVYKLQEDLGEGEFFSQLKQYSLSIEKVKVNDNVNLFIINN